MKTTRLLADYVLKTRSGQVPVSAPVSGDPDGSSPATSLHPGRVSMGFSARDTNLVLSMTGQDAVLVTNIQRPGKTLARVRLLAVDPQTSRLIAEVLARGSPEPAPPAAARDLSPTRPHGVRVGLLVPGAILGLLVLVAIGWIVQSPTDRRCASSSDCPEGFACASWPRPSPADADYRSCERVCQTDRDCPGSGQCFLLDDGPAVVGVCRSGR